MRSVEVCLTPELIHQHDLEGKITVVVDIFRATSCIVAGIGYGVSAIWPVLEVEECIELGKRGMITAGERGGKKLDEFDIGNSPFDYMNDEFIGKEIAISTTNGTRTISASGNSEEIIIGSFLNISSTATYLSSKSNSVLIHCAGWKGTPNVEDTLFAGALISEMEHEISGDSAIMAKYIYQKNKHDLLSTARESGHARRLAGFGVKKDIEFCLTKDHYNDLVVRFDGKKLVKN